MTDPKMVELSLARASVSHLITSWSPIARLRRSWRGPKKMLEELYHLLARAGVRHLAGL